MTRIVAGAARGRRLRVPPGTSTRPTSDRVREAMFSSIESRLRTLAGRRVLDLYAGSGALGLEALSRGAAYARLVDADAKAARTMKANVTELGFEGAEVIRSQVAKVIKGAAPSVPYDLVLADPPYDMTNAELGDILDALTKGWLTADALVVVERASRGEPLTWPAGLEPVHERRYGETMLWYGQPVDHE